MQARHPRFGKRSIATVSLRMRHGMPDAHSPDVLAPLAGGDAGEPLRGGRRASRADD